MGDQLESHPTIELHGDEFWPLSGKPFFTTIISKSNVDPLYTTMIPAKLSHDLLPILTPTVLTFRGKSWEMHYHGHSNKRLDHNWKAFAVDNNLKIGDACVFDVQESSATRLVFRVQILRGDLPSEFEEKLEGETETTNHC